MLGGALGTRGQRAQTEVHSKHQAAPGWETTRGESACPGPGLSSSGFPGAGSRGRRLSSHRADGVAGGKGFAAGSGAGRDKSPSAVLVLFCVLRGKVQKTAGQCPPVLISRV